MKKMMAAFLTLALLASQTVFAATDTAKLQEALVSVKAKLEIPEELTEFRSSTSEYGDGESRYTFTWNNKDYTKRMNVYTDKDGHIYSVDRYDSDWYKDQSNAPRIYEYDKAEIADFAKSYLQKLIPEAFADANDALQYDEPASVGNLDHAPSFYVTFKRIKDGIEVQENSAGVNVRLLPSELLVQGCDVNWDYGKTFESLEGVISAQEAEAAYKSTFPLELIYRKYGTKDERKILLEYILDDASANYIDAKTGKQVTRDMQEYGNARNAGSGVSNKYAMAEAAMDELSPAEQEEIQNIAGLKSVNEIVAAVKGMAELALPADMQVENSNLRKIDETYIYNINMSNGKEDQDGRYLSITADAKTGLVTALYTNRSYYYDSAREKNRAELTEAQTAAYREKAEKFLKTYYADQFANAKADEESYSVMPVYYSDDTLYFSYIRQIDGIPYVNNSISISWDAEYDRLSSFNLNWDDSVANAPKKNAAINADNAYNAVLEEDPVKLVYILINDVYTPVYAINGTHTTVNALSGALIDYSGEPIETNTNTSYADLDGHWAKDMVTALGTYGIRLTGDTFRPDEEITQKDFLSLVYATLNNGYLYRTTEEELYNRLINLGILSENEKAPAAAVKKENALKYLLRAMGIKEVAELQGIYICDFKDAVDITPANLGYCAIAKGFGIVSGSDGCLYPQKSITRAEAMTLLYKYLTR